MGDTTLVMIDSKEKRKQENQHYMYLCENLVAALCRDPSTIEEFNRTHKEIFGKLFFDDGNRPRVPEELTLDTIKLVLGLKDPIRKLDGSRETVSDDDVLTYWKRISEYKDANYALYVLKEKLPHMPRSLQNIINNPARWNAKGIPTLSKRVKRSYDDGIVVADLRTKMLMYASDNIFTMTRSVIVADKWGLERDYFLPKTWRLIEL